MFLIIFSVWIKKNGVKVFSMPVLISSFLEAKCYLNSLHNYGAAIIELQDLVVSLFWRCETRSRLKVLFIFFCCLIDRKLCFSAVSPDTVLDWQTFVVGRVHWSVIVKWGQHIFAWIDFLDSNKFAENAGSSICRK